MLENCVFHDPVIPYDTLKRLASDLTLNVFTQLYLLWTVPFNRFRKILYFQNIVTFFYFGWLFTALRFRKCTKSSYKMNNNSI